MSDLYKQLESLNEPAAKVMSLLTTVSKEIKDIENYLAKLPIGLVVLEVVTSEGYKVDLIWSNKRLQANAMGRIKPLIEHPANLRLALRPCFKDFLEKVREELNRLSNTP